METCIDQQNCPQAKQEQQRQKSRLERWIEKLEERIAPCGHINPQGKFVGGNRNSYDQHNC
jgi:hypothetical protein